LAVGRNPVWLVALGCDSPGFLRLYALNYTTLNMANPTVSVALLCALVAVLKSMFFAENLLKSSKRRPGTPL
jgi:hypothetical protein